MSSKKDFLGIILKGFTTGGSLLSNSFNSEDSPENHSGRFV
jgi:hypothetical protein